MIRLRRLTAMISAVNDYTLLKWPLTIGSVLITVVAFLLLLSFHSDAWFTYEVTNRPSAQNTTVTYSGIVEQGSFGLWKYCQSKYNDPGIICGTFTRESRPQNFSLILILLSCALFISNLAFFPTWATTILILYNTNNRYVPHILVFLWIVFLLALTITAILICIMIFIATTTFYSPGTGSTNLYRIKYYIGSGVFLAFSATILAIIWFLSVITSLLWEKYIELKLIEADKELYRQLADDNFQPGWHQPIKIPRTTTATFVDDFNDPPPYSYGKEGADD